MKPSNWVLAVVALALCLPSDSLGVQERPSDVGFAARFHYSKAETLVHQCKAVENLNPDTNVAPEKDVSDVSLCLGFISGVVDLDTLDSGFAKHPVSGWCVPDSTSATQLAKVVVKYGNDHPEELHFSAIMVVSNAFHKAFPCS